MNMYLAFSDHRYNAGGGKRRNIGANKEAGWSHEIWSRYWWVQDHPQLHCSQSGEKYYMLSSKTNINNIGKTNQQYWSFTHQVDQTNYEGDCDGNLLHQAIETQKKDHVVALLEHGWPVFLLIQIQMISKPILNRLQGGPSNPEALLRRQHITASLGRQMYQAIWGFQHRNLWHSARGNGRRHPWWYEAWSVVERVVPRRGRWQRQGKGKVLWGACHFDSRIGEVQSHASSLDDWIHTLPREQCTSQYPKDFLRS